MVTSKPKEEQTRLQRWTSTASTQWHAFLGFIWNPTEKTVLGRGASSWGRITIFYVFYYSFLAALFAISITIVLNTLDPNIPRFQTRLQGPGISIQPRQESKDALNSDIMYTLSDSSSFAKYITQMDIFLEKYRNQSNSSKFKDCADSKVNLSYTKEGNRDEIFQQACRFDLAELRACQDRNATYGYAAGKPCILIKVNRIINWFPVGYTDVSQVGDNPVSKAPRLLDVLKGRGSSTERYNPRRMYVACYGLTEADQRSLNGETGVSRNTTYYPESGGIPFKYYPYLGNRRNPNYLTPVVAVQFNNVQRDVEINVGCKAYARNIVDDIRVQIGFYNFRVEIKS